MNGMDLGLASFPRVYSDLLNLLVGSRISERNERTGERINMWPGGTGFNLDLTDQRLPVPGVRKVFPRTAAAETAWYLQGTQNVTWLREYAKIWDKFTEADGVTIDAAYGYRWRKRFGRDQIALAIEALRNNPTDRRVWVNAWDPHHDGLGAEGQKNVPCPVGFSFNVMGGLLHSSIVMRSSDVFVGLPYDVMGHAMLMAVMAASIGLPGLGSMHVTLCHAHLYEKHFGMALEALRQPVVDERPPLMAWDLSRVEAEPDAFVWTYGKAGQSVRWPEFNPRPEVIA